MKEHAVPTATHGAAARRGEVKAARLEQLDTGLDVRSGDRLGRSITHIILGVGEAVGGVEEEVRVTVEDEMGDLDEAAVRVIAVEDLHGVADGGEAVVGNLLQEDGGGFHRRDAVVAVAAVADAVAVDLEDDVAAAVLVEEAGRVDGAALAEPA